MSRMAGWTNDTAELPRSGRRFAAFGLVAFVLLVVLAVRLFQVQVVDGHVYAARVAAERTVELTVPAPRGLIFDRAGRQLALNVPAWTVSIRPADVPQAERERVLALLADLTGADAAAIAERLDEYAGSPIDLLPVLRGLTRETALLVAEKADQLPGVVIETDTLREYRDETGAVAGELLAHVIGYTGRIDADELSRMGDSGYAADDVLGKAGVEASFEDELRGDPGLQLAERDADGRVVKVLEVIREPQPGTNLMLTIDARTQRLATDALRWGMEVAGVSQGVTIVMNPQTGEILAMVSLPTYDGNTFASGITSDEFAAYLEDPNLPLRNHAISDIYPPGSTYKLVTSIAALEEGITTAGAAVADLRVLPDPRRPRGRVPVRLEPPGLRAARHRRRLRRELRHLLLPARDRGGNRSPGRMGGRARLRAAHRHPATRGRGRDHRLDRLGPAAGPRGCVHRRGGAGRASART